MKIIQISDPHLVAPGRRLWGLDPAERLGACLADVARRHADADLAVITGDLTDRGEAAAYALLRDLVARLPMPVRFLLGNHDDRAAFRTAVPEAPVDSRGFVQSVLDRGRARLIFLDTLDPGATAGRLCRDRLAWLGERLDEARGRDVLLFLHHPPMPVGIPGMDAIALTDPDRLRAAISRARVRHLFCGHLHRPVSGSWAGIPFTVLRATGHQVELDFDRADEVLGNHEPPQYGVILVEAGDVVVHCHDFLDASPRFSFGAPHQEEWRPPEEIP